VETRRLGHSDLEITRVAFGAWAIGGLMWGGADERDAVGAIAAALDAGVNTIDTAPVYGCGRSEELVGRALRGRRDGVVVATKCGLRWDRPEGPVRFDTPTPDGGRVRVHYNLRPDSLREECEASLRRLGVEAIDLYQIHWPSPVDPLEDALDALVRLRDEGKVRWLGVSNCSVEQLAVARACDAVVAVQPPLSLVDRRSESEVLPFCRENDLGVVAYSPMGRGLLTGRVGADRAFDASDHRSEHPSFSAENRDRVARALARARPLAQRHGASLANLAVAWVLATPGVTAALVGARNAKQASENARAAAVSLSPEEWSQLAEIFPNLPPRPVRAD
jgi:aryl-alcohol dehydrogenase-like predicted oxidoreductase